MKGTLPIPPRLSRRRLLAGPALGLAASPAAFIAACGGNDGSSQSDLETLNRMLEGEHLQEAVYSHAARILAGERLRLAERFGEQEREHADLLRELIEELGGRPVEARSQRSYRRRLRLQRLEDGDQFIRAAVDLENATVGAYQAALLELSSSELRRRFMTILAVEAQQMSVLLGELGEVQVPDPFVTGVAA